MTKEKSIPAFPSQDTGAVGFSEGMTMRQWYAGKALQGYMASPVEGPALDMKGNLRYIAELCFDYADAMIVAEAAGKSSGPNTLTAALRELVRCVRGGDQTAGVSMDDALQDADAALAETEAA